MNYTFEEWKEYEAKEVNKEFWLFYRDISIGIITIVVVMSIIYNLF